jgi:hypothetical protein
MKSAVKSQGIRESPDSSYLVKDNSDIAHK